MWEGEGGGGGGRDVIVMSYGNEEKLLQYQMCLHSFR